MKPVGLYPMAHYLSMAGTAATLYDLDLVTWLPGAVNQKRP
jgi:hypothetical protein